MGKILKQILLLLQMFFSVLVCADSGEVIIGTKVFTEGVILSEIIRTRLDSLGVDTSEVKELGGTPFIWNALVNGEIDLYVDYTGTIMKEIFSQHFDCEHQLKDILANYHIDMSDSLGFSNSYGLGMPRALAHKLNVKTISDLKKHPGLRVFVTHEFIERDDGYRALKNHYQLNFSNVGRIEHTLAFKGIEAKTVDVMDVYTTEAEIDHYNLVVLQDDRNFFGNYHAVILYRQDLINKCPSCPDILAQFSGLINEQEMRQLNKKVLLEGSGEREVAREFLQRKFGGYIADDSENWVQLKMLMVYTKDHIILVGISMFFASIVGVILGVLAARFSRFGHVILIIVSILQTIPSLALLVLMIPLFGIGTLPALVALFFYALLPIVRNTATGLAAISRPVHESAVVIGLTSMERLFKIELPMASREIMAGLKTATIICVGTATLGALIGAGGYGQPILTGIRMLDNKILLQGAIPAALMAITCQGAFSFLDRLVIPKGLRIESSTQDIS